MIASPHRDIWDARYASDAFLFGTRPNAFLAAQAHRLLPGMRALALADGEGRNGVWLARQGLAVSALDISPVAQEKARRHATEAGVDIRFTQADLLDWDGETSAYDLIAAIFIQFADAAQRPRLHRAIGRSLVPGGLLLLQGYTPRQLQYRSGGPSQIGNLYSAAELRQDFAGLDLLHLREHEQVLCEGAGHCGMSALVDLVARKPLA